MQAPLPAPAEATPSPRDAAPRVAENPTAVWTASRFFTLLARLGRLRVISICGPSVFESLCRAGSFSIEDGSLNMISDEFHWHVDLARFRHLRSHDTVHGRSGRNVLFFELRERAESVPFLRIYVYRAQGVEFDAQVAAAFAGAHAELAAGAALVGEGA
jgi:hypothetical protein